MIHLTTIGLVSPGVWLHLRLVPRSWRRRRLPRRAWRCRYRRLAQPGRRPPAGRTRRGRRVQSRHWLENRRPFGVTEEFEGDFFGVDERISDRHCNRSWEIVEDAGGQGRSGCRPYSVWRRDRVQRPRPSRCRRRVQEAAFLVGQWSGPACAR